MSRQHQSLDEEHTLLSQEMTQNSTTLESFISELTTMLEPMEEQLDYEDDDYLYYDEEERVGGGGGHQQHFSPQGRYTVASPQWVREEPKSSGTGGSSKPKARTTQRKGAAAAPQIRNNKMKVPTLQGNSLSNS